MYTSLQMCIHKIWRRKIQVCFCIRFFFKYTGHTNKWSNHYWFMQIISNVPIKCFCHLKPKCHIPCICCTINNLRVILSSDQESNCAHLYIGKEKNDGINIFLKNRKKTQNTFFHLKCHDYIGIFQG